MHYAIGGRQIFTGLDLTIRRGRITAIMGPSGGGKTTLLKLITGQVFADRGSVRVFGQDVATLGRRALYALRQRLGLLFQNGALLTDMDVFDNAGEKVGKVESVYMGNADESRVPATPVAISFSSSRRSW